jgi:hypothetical protein
MLACSLTANHALQCCPWLPLACRYEKSAYLFSVLNAGTGIRALLTICYDLS